MPPASSLGHIARDELARSGSVPPSPSTGEGEGEGEAAPSFPRKREPIPAPAEADLTVTPAFQGGGDEDGLPPSPSPLTGEGWGEGEGAPSFPRRACPVLDTGREPIPSTANADDPHTATATESSFPPSRESIPIPGPAEEDDPELTDPDRGCYDIDRKIAEAQRDPSHPIHKFVQAYDEVAAVFHGEDNENDDDDEVRYWISGEVPRCVRQVHLGVRPGISLGRSEDDSAPGAAAPDELGTTPKAESVWMKRPTDKLREAGVPPTQTVHTNLGLNPPRRPTGPSGANTMSASSDRRAASCPFSPGGRRWSLP